MLILELAFGIPGGEKLLARGRSIPRRIGLTHEIPADFTTFGKDDAARFRDYLSAVSEDIYVNAIRFLATRTGLAVKYAAPVPVQTTGIYHPRASHTFDEIEAYRQWLDGRIPDPDPPWVALLFYYSQMVERNPTKALLG